MMILVKLIVLSVANSNMDSFDASASASVASQAPRQAPDGGIAGLLMCEEVLRDPARRRAILRCVVFTSFSLRIERREHQCAVNSEPVRLLGEDGYHKISWGIYFYYFKYK
jgi:hypothetical protein